MLINWANLCYLEAHYLSNGVFGSMLAFDLRQDGLCLLTNLQNLG
jgi:hypothetical protein